MLGIVGKAKALASRLESFNKPSDFRVRFRVHERQAKSIIPTDITTATYGGWYYQALGMYIPSPELDYVPVRELPCSRTQYDLLIASDTHIPKLECGGGRGSGKSESAICYILKQIANNPGADGRIISPTFPLTRVLWKKFMRVCHPRWIVEGPSGISLSHKEIKFKNGFVLSFASAKYPNSLRSWGGSFQVIDEAQDVSTEAVDVAWFCLRESETPQMIFTLTPSVGEAYDRHLEHLELEKDGDAKVVTFSSYSNPFVDKKVFDYARKKMDKDRYKIEVEADWNVIERMTNEAVNFVFANFRREEFEIDYPPMGIDKTYVTVAKKIHGIKHIEYILGVDPNYNYPNFAVILKVFSGVDKGDPDRWVVIDVVSKKGHCGHLGRTLKEMGYGNSIVVPDCSSRYWLGAGKRSPEMLLRSEGFMVHMDRKNPIVTTSLDAVQWRLFPVDGAPSLFFRRGRCDELLEAMEKAQWAKDGKHIDKKDGIDHVIDALRYPISYLSPAAKLPTRFAIDKLAQVSHTH